jgi:hypothetical protein
MFLRYLEPIIAPFRKARATTVKAKNVKGNVKVEAARAKSYGKLGQNKLQDARGKVGGAQGQAQAAGAQAQAVGGQVPGAPGMTAPGAAPPGGAAVNPQTPNPGIVKVGLFRRKHVCQQCQNELDKTWDHCPYCAQVASAANQKTQAFMVDAAGTGTGMQMLGWLVPVKGPLRGELYTLAPHSVIGTEPTCTVVLADPYMSSRHAEIRAESGVWILVDLGSTNGTFVNNNRVDKHELVDNDFVTFGQSLVKFKSL